MSSTATDSPVTPSALPDSALQLAVEAKELVEGIYTVTDVTADEKGTELNRKSEYHNAFQQWFFLKSNSLFRNEILFWQYIMYIATGIRARH